MARVGILGCGPAGLLAAHGAALRGAEVIIFSKKQESYIHGAQYIHRAIPGITHHLPDAQVNFLKYGDPGTYAKKIYQDATAETSWDDYPAGLHPIWSMQNTYALLWQIYANRIVDTELDDNGDVLWEILKGKWDLVISTVPAKVLCIHQHSFLSQAVWITRQADQLLPNNTIVYDGTEDTLWYRQSKIFSNSATEFGHEVMNATRITKPLSTDCNCWPQVMRAGRYGEWRKKALAHDAFEKLVHAL